MKKLAILVIFGGGFLLSARPAVADYVTYPPGCYKCTEHPSIIGSYEDCTQVGNNTSGDGIYCKEFQSLLIRLCQTSGGACYYTETGGGSSGGGGGGGGCNTSGGMCPIECFDCGPQLY